MLVAGRWYIDQGTCLASALSGLILSTTWSPKHLQLYSPKGLQVFRYISRSSQQNEGVPSISKPEQHHILRPVCSTERAENHLWRSSEHCLGRSISPNSHSQRFIFIKSVVGLKFIFKSVVRSSLMEFFKSPLLSLMIIICSQS